MVWWFGGRQVVSLASTMVEGIPDAEVLTGHLMVEYSPAAISALVDAMTVETLRVDIGCHWFTPSGVIDRGEGA